VQPRVLDGERRPPRELGRERKVAVRVATLRLGRGERERTDGAVAREERDEDRGPQPELARDPQVLRVGCAGGQEVVGDLGVHLGLPGPEHVRYAGGRVRP
jgi:hypothetical protein